MDADRLAGLHVPVTQLNTDSGFGGECHLDANMVRSAIPGAAARGDRPADRRERRQPRVSGRVSHRRGRARDGDRGHRGRGQAAEVPADVPGLRAGAGQQDRPAAAPRLRPRVAALQHRPGPPRRGADRRSARGPARESTPGGSGCCGSPPARRSPHDEDGARRRLRPSAFGRCSTQRTAGQSSVLRGARRSARAAVPPDGRALRPRRPSDRLRTLARRRARTPATWRWSSSIR